MLPDRVSNPGPLTYESGALPIALRGPAYRVGGGGMGRAKYSLHYRVGGQGKIFFTLLNNFTDERIEIKIIKSMSDSELSRLGVTTMGKLDRYWKIAHIIRS